MISFGGLTVTPHQLIAFLKSEMRIRDLCKQEIYNRIVNSTAADKGITISEAEIQVEADKFRHQMQLESAKDTLRWLEEQLIMPEDWEAGIRQRLTAQKLAEYLFKSEVSTYFTQNKLNYQKVVLYRLVVDREALAQELYFQITETETSFYQAAHLHDISEDRRLRCGYEGNQFRWNFKPDIAAQVFGSKPKEILGPMQSDEGFDLFMVEDFLTTELTSEVHDQILNKLFQEWLEREFVYLIHKDS